ncbi:MAG: sulfurtransferase [Deltaproteobacteria bacterium]|nr:sulfurtransferase [Deltaproteobacteria bacterium]
MHQEPVEVVPVELQSRLGRPGAPVIVDVREAWEVALAPFPHAVHIPLGELTTRAAGELSPDAETVVVCHHGVRSLQGTRVLRSLGFRAVRSLRGGADLWSRTVDPSVARY